MINRTIDSLKLWAKKLKSEIYTLYVAMRDPRTPLLARYFALFVIGYALSPIDLIPDFIPVLGMLDDLILLPLGIALLRQMIPSVVMVASRRQAEALMRSGLPASRNAAMVIMAIWALVLAVSIGWLTNQLVFQRSVTNEPPISTSPVNTEAVPDKPKNKGQNRDRSRERKQAN